MTDDAAVAAAEQAIYDVAVDHPMWVDGAGQPLDFLPAREARIAEFVHEAGKAATAAVRGPLVALAAQWDGLLATESQIMTTSQRNAWRDALAELRHALAAAAAPVAAPTERPEIVVLCGSTRFKDAFREAAKSEALAGRIVLTVSDLDPRPEMRNVNVPIDPDTKAMLDRLHRHKIDLADRVLVLNVSGYIGESTRGEIDYATAHGKPITYLESPAAPTEPAPEPARHLGEQANAEQCPACTIENRNLSYPWYCPAAVGAPATPVEPVDLLAALQRSIDQARADSPAAPSGEAHRQAIGRAYADEIAEQDAAPGEAHWFTYCRNGLHTVLAGASCQSCGPEQAGEAHQ